MKNHRYRAKGIDIELIISILDYNYRYRNKKVVIELDHTISIFVDIEHVRYRLSILCKFTVGRRQNAASSPSKFRISFWHGSFPWPKHVENASTFSLDSNRTSFFKTPAHHAIEIVSNVIKGWRKSPLELTLQVRSEMVF
jgi:hypothetical protein